MLTSLGGLVASSKCYAGSFENNFEADFDRLDGTGSSHKTVNVIEWEGNLEIHVYPQGSLKGLSLKLDKKNKDRPVMVIGYRFDSSLQRALIRRAILSIDLKDGFKAYRDPSAEEYDKIIISNNGLSSDLLAYKLDPESKQLYPDGHPMNRLGANRALASKGSKAKSDKKGRAPASENEANSKPGEISSASQAREASKPSEKSQKSEPSQIDEFGTIRPFKW